MVSLLRCKASVLINASRTVLSGIMDLFGLNPNPNSWVVVHLQWLALHVLWGRTTPKLVKQRFLLADHVIWERTATEWVIVFAKSVYVISTASREFLMTVT